MTLNSYQGESPPGGFNPAQPLAIVYRPIEALKLDPRNPRVHSPKQLRQIANSIKTFGFNVPVLVDGQLQIIAGHGRVMACRQLGWKEVPTVQLEHLTDAQARAFMIADNRLTENSVWDDNLLAEQLKELSLLSLDFDIDVTGFEMGEIDFRIEQLDAGKSPEEDPADIIPAQMSLSISQAGDLWILGRHRILCASALEEASYSALMADERAAMIFTDPPYNVPINGNVGGLGAIEHREFAMASGEMTEEQFTAFLKQTCDLMARYSRDGSIHFICMDWRHMGELLAAGKETFSELKNVCVWAKTNAGMGSLYRSQHELVFVFKHGSAPHRNNVELGRYGRNRTNIWNYPSVSAFGRVTEEGNLLALHPTVKPVAMVADAIMDCSARGDLILDSYLGSGTTLIAAERTGRRCYGLEIDPVYADTIIRRWQAYAGEKAILARTGDTFDNLYSIAEAGHG
jgi:DNA modification methylase